MKLLKISIITLIAILSLSIPAVSTSALTIKLGTLAPEGSPYDKALKRIAAEWNVISNGRITIKIYPGGIVGGEYDMIRKMRINQLQAAAITGVAMSQIAIDTITFQIPFLVRTDEELDYVLEKIRPTLDSKLAEKGFKILAFTKAGWVHIFARYPVVTPEDLMRQKMHVSEGNSALNMAWREMGFHIIPLPATEVVPGLQSGMIDAFTTTPLLAAAMQWFGIARNMSELRWAPMTGGIVISQRAWKRIPKELQPKLQAAIPAIMDDMYKETMEIEKQALKIMLENGLVINPVPPEAEKQWKELVRRGFNILVGKTFSREVYEAVEGYLEEFRNNNAR